MKKLRDIVENKNYKPQEDESEIVHRVVPDGNFGDHIHPLSHFGTKATSRSFLVQRSSNYDSDDHKFHVYSGRIKLGNVIHVDDIGEHDTHNFAEQLHDNGHISTKDHEKIQNSEVDSPEAMSLLVNALKKRNINTIAYRNEYESVGDKSYVITDPSQFRILRKGTIKATEGVRNRVLDDYLKNKNNY